MNDEINKDQENINNRINEAQDAAENAGASSYGTFSEQTPGQETPHTSVPGGTNGTSSYYNPYQNAYNDPSYRYRYGNGEQTRVNPYSQTGYGSYGSGYNQNNAYSRYDYSYGQQTRQAESTDDTGKKKKKSNTALIVVITVAIVCVIMFSLAAFVVGMLVRGSSRPSGTNDPQTTDNGVITPGTDDTSDTTKAAPATDPDVTFAVSTDPVYGDMTEAAAKTVNSVVEIRTEQTVSGTFMQQYIQEGAGSGVIVSADGYIITNNHVIAGATLITVILRDGTEYKATLVGTDAQADLAVVKVEATGLNPATFGDSDKLVVAQTVIAIGNPLGELGGSVTNGIISALERTVVIENQEMTLLQTTAAVNPGNSGGGLFNMAGECVGIVNAKSSGSDIEGIGFAIPSNTAIKVAEDLIHYGYVRGRVMLGISMLEIYDKYTAKKYGVNDYGVYVSAVGEGSDAAKAGMESGDRLVSINGTEVDSYATAKKLIQACSVGETAVIVVSRNGSEKTLNVTFSEYIPQ